MFFSLFIHLLSSFYSSSAIVTFLFLAIFLHISSSIFSFSYFLFTNISFYDLVFSSCYLSPSLSLSSILFLLIAIYYWFLTVIYYHPLTAIYYYLLAYCYLSSHFCCCHLSLIFIRIYIQILLISHLFTSPNPDFFYFPWHFLSIYHHLIILPFYLSITIYFYLFLTSFYLTAISLHVVISYFCPSLYYLFAFFFLLAIHCYLLTSLPLMSAFPLTIFSISLSRVYSAFCSIFSCSLSIYLLSLLIYLLLDARVHQTTAICCTYPLLFWSADWGVKGGVPIFLMCCLPLQIRSRRKRFPKVFSFPYKGFDKVVKRQGSFGCWVRAYSLTWHKSISTSYKRNGYRLNVGSDWEI